MDGQRKFKFCPSLCEDAYKLEESPFPNWSGKNFDQNLFPEVSPVSGCGRLKFRIYSLEIRVTSIGAFPNVFRYVLAELLHPSLDRLTVRGDFLGIRQTI